jgi:hypothetical protein
MDVEMSENENVNRFENNLFKPRRVATALHLFWHLQGRMKLKK